MATNQSAHVGREGLFEKFRELAIETTTVEHPEVFTVSDMMTHLEGVDGAHCKNLFLRDKKKKLYLLSTRHDSEVKLADIAKMIGASGTLRFADESILLEKLGVRQGCVTAYALINDTKNDVKFIIDAALTSDRYKKIFFHPLSNDASTGISPNDLLKFVEATGHETTYITLD